jgi:putative oxidoreductase
VNAARTTYGSLNTDRAAINISLLIIRVSVGVIMAAHGAQKVFGLWGGPGLEKIMAPGGPGGGGIVGLLVAIGECFGGLGIALGILSRFSAAANILIMLGAIALVHGRNGFFLSNKGFEYNLALIGLLLPVVIAGPGRYSIGRLLPWGRSLSSHPLLKVFE